MSAVEKAVQKVKLLSEENAEKLLVWLRLQEQFSKQQNTSKGATASIGFARQFHKEHKTTVQWMAELREGEKD